MVIEPIQEAGLTPAKTYYTPRLSPDWKVSTPMWTIVAVSGGLPLV